MDRVSRRYRRGDVVTVATAGAYTGKPRPALVVQGDLWNPTHPSVTLALITSTPIDASLFRVALTPSAGNGLRSPSQVMVDKLASVPSSALGEVVGRLDAVAMRDVDAALRRWLDLA